MALNNLLRPRLIELGKIKVGGLGAEKKSRTGSTYRMPVKYDHFVVTTLTRNQHGDLAPDDALMKSLEKYADHDGKLRQLPVMVVSNEIEDVMQSAWVWYQGQRVAGRSDGKTLTLFYDHRKKEWYDKPREVEWDDSWADIVVGGQRLFKLHTTVNVVIADPQARCGGIYKFRTTSQITADQIYGSLVHMRQLTGGFLRGLPMYMVVRPMKVSPNGQVTTVYVVHMEFVGADLQEIQDRAMKRAQFELANAQVLRQTQIEYRKLLALPGYETTDEQAANAREFHPEAHDGDDSEPAKPPTGPDPLAAQLGLATDPPAVVPADQPPVADPNGPPPGDDGDPDHDPFGGDSASGDDPPPDNDGGADGEQDGLFGAGREDMTAMRN